MLVLNRNGMCLRTVLRSARFLFTRRFRFFRPRFASATESCALTSIETFASATPAPSPNSLSHLRRRISQRHIATRRNSSLRRCLLGRGIQLHSLLNILRAQSAQFPHPSPSAAAPVAQTPSSSATHPNPKARIASRILLTCDTKSAAQSQPSAQPS